MKALFSLLLCMLFVAAPAQNADLDVKQVPKKVTDSFTKEQPGITPTWRADGVNFKAIYTDPKTKVGGMIVFDKNGEVIRRESELDKLNSPTAPDNSQPKNH